MKPDITAISPTAPTPPDPPETFAVNDAASANWLVRKIVEARAYAKHVKAWADAEVRRAEQEEAFFLQRYGHQLEAWARQQIANARRRSVKLPAGTVGFRTDPPKLEVIDEAKLLSWCRQELPAALRVETHVLKSLVRDHVAQTGECPVGAEVGGGGQRFYVK
ncbi:MAG TPA: host-nuclease inhibitor Gam family protein [Tepidisphaeraceae bacterium]|jgi:hypothetical protein